jgi:LPXTG-motif cell wall-anchored protein
MLRAALMISGDYGGKPPMHLSVPRRLLAVLAAVALTLVWGAPVQAAAKVKVDFLVKDYTLAPGTGALLTTVLFADRRVPVGPGGVSIVYRFVDQGPGFHFQEAGTPNNCSVGGPDNLLVLNCSPGVEALTPSGVDSALVGWVVAGDDAVAGTKATLTATMTVKGYAPVTRTATVRIGERAGLTSGDTARDTSAPVGGSLDVPLTVTNTGSAPIRGTGLYSYAQYAFEARTQYSNCYYVGGEMRGCRFDQTLEPGATYRLTVPFRVRRDTYAPSDQYGQWQWMTADEFADQQRFIEHGGFEPLGTPGKGGVLRLTRLATAKAEPPQALPEFVADDMKVAVTGKQSTDLAAVGDTAAGPKGAIVTVSVGLRNNGPATIDRTRINPAYSIARVFVPAETTAVRVPNNCAPTTADGVVDINNYGAPGAARYTCVEALLLKVGQTSTGDFGLRIDKVVSGARGAVAVGAPADQLNKADDNAAIVINGPGSGGGSGPGGSNGGGGDSGSGSGGGQGGGGGGLPITGPQGATIGAIGALLVLGGAAGFVIARRRRTRFEA